MKALFYIAVFSILLFSCSSDKTETPERVTGEPSVTVKVMRAAAVSGFNTRGYVGTVSAARTVVLSCKYPGTLVSMMVSRGDFVNKGDVLAEVFSQTVNSTYQMAEATLKQAEDGLERSEKVYESGSISEVKMVEIRTQVEKARASADAAGQAVEDCRIKAPFSGYVGDVFVEEGVDITVMEPLLKILDLSSVEIHISVPENEFTKVTEGQKAFVDIPALDMKDIQATVVSKGISASPLSHSYDCTLRLLSDNPGIMPGMVGKVYIDDPAYDGIVLPASVVKTDVSGRYVWAVDDGVVYKKYIKTAGFASDGLIVSDGLDDGDYVIVEGMHKVSSGMRVKIQE